MFADSENERHGEMLAAILAHLEMVNVQLAIMRGQSGIQAAEHAADATLEAFADYSGADVEWLKEESRHSTRDLFRVINGGRGADDEPA